MSTDQRHDTKNTHAHTYLIAFSCSSMRCSWPIIRCSSAALGSCCCCCCAGEPSRSCPAPGAWMRTVCAGCACHTGMPCPSPPAPPDSPVTAGCCSWASKRWVSADSLSSRWSNLESLQLRSQGGSKVARLEEIARWLEGEVARW